MFFFLKQGLKGYAHLGVYRFDDNWDKRHEATLKPKLPDRLQGQKGYVWGYPNYVFVEAKEPEKAKTLAQKELIELHTQTVEDGEG